jgi:hypothetical protein
MYMEANCDGRTGVGCVTNTSPKMTCLPSSHGVDTVVMKNCDIPLRFSTTIEEIRTIAVQANRNLAAVGVRTRVGHAQLPGLGVAELEVLVRKLVSIDGLAASAIALGEIPSLMISCSVKN